jgi:7-keto-8-aminopelargonate synthetase-like enzyme
MTTTFDQELARRLAELRDHGLYRELRRIDSPQGPRIKVGGQAMLNFSSNDYLGLAAEPALKEAARQALEEYGAGAGASRLICGSLAPHHQLEEALAAFKGAQAALSFSTGYAAALGTIGALAGKGDIVILDKLVHACIVDAARLSGAKLRVFDHNDMADLKRLLQWAEERGERQKAEGRRQKAEGDAAEFGLESALPLERGAPLALGTPPSGGRSVLIVTESIFSMDGDQAPLRQLVALKEKYGAWLMVDEAHATGLYGLNGRGLAEELGVSHRIEIQMGTLGKALGASGGYICGSKTLIEYLVNRARSFVFSTAPVPAAVAAATAGIRFIQSTAGQERRRLLWQHVSEVRSFLAGQDRWPCPSSPPCAIIPLMLGQEDPAVLASAALRNQGIFIPAIRYPTVPRGQARLRLTLTAAHTPADLEQLMAALRTLNL